MSALKGKTVCVIDCGLFSSLAEKLAGTAGRVIYWTPWIEAFVKDSALQIGVGLPGVERVKYWEPLKKKIDLFVFPDCYFGPIALDLEEQGYPVWSSRMGENLELDREDAKQKMAKLGIPIGAWARVDGMYELRTYLQEHDNVRVKLSFTRGDMESFHSPSYKLVKPRLDKMEHDLGPRAEEKSWICEESIDDAMEIAYDGYSVDGQFPKEAMWGVEIKSSSYLGIWSDYDKMPWQITACNEALSDYLKAVRYRNWMSLEMRVDRKGTPWVIDPCMRFGNPPGALCLEMYKNLPDILWEGADGKCIDPVGSDRYGCQIVMHSSWSEREWQPVYFPKDLRKHVKLVNATVKKGIDYVIPGPDFSSAVGSIVATGKTPQEAIEKCKAIGKEIEGYGLEIETDSCGKAEEALSKMKDYKIQV